MKGGGKYGDDSERLLRRLHADAVVVMVLGGEKGSGMSASQVWDWDMASGSLEALKKLPAVLRAMADEIEKDTAPK